MSAALVCVAGGCAPAGSDGASAVRPAPTPPSAPEPPVGPVDHGGDGGAGTPDTGASPPSITRPPGEPCDGYDNTGDGQVDEGCACELGTTQACYPGPPGSDRGACTRGLQACGDAADGAEFHAWGACVGYGAPATEVCGNGVDEDCDGVDVTCATPTGCTPGETRACYDGPAGTEGLGACHAGVLRCTDARTYGACEGAVVPTAEVCGDAEDEDCDGVAELCPECTPGETRACYAGPPGTAGRGVCRAGTQTCSGASTWESCVGAVLPRSETCDNGIDEDCSGGDAHCAAPFELVSISYPSSIRINAPASDLDATWTGDAAFPVTAYFRNTGCPAGFTCADPYRVFTTPANPLHWPSTLYCYGGPLHAPVTLHYEFWLVDATGAETSRHDASFQCTP